jgi:hypothetical protein
MGSTYRKLLNNGPGASDSRGLEGQHGVVALCENHLLVPLFSKWY